MILLIDGILYRTQNIISTTKNTDLIYQVLRYPRKRSFKMNGCTIKTSIEIDVSMLFDKINYIFTTPCCACLRNATNHLASQDFNELAILADTKGNVNIFHFPSMSVIYDVPNIFQSQSVDIHRERESYQDFDLMSCRFVNPTNVVYSILDFFMLFQLSCVLSNTKRKK